MLSSFACFGVILWYMFLPYRQTVGKQLVWVHPKASCFSNQSGLIGDVFLTDWWTPAKLQSSFLLTTYWNFTEMTLVWVHNEMKNNISIVIHSFKNTLRLVLLNRDLQTRAEVRTVRGCRYEPYLSSLWCVPWETWRLPGLRQMKVRWCERTSLQRAQCGTLRALEKLSLKGWEESRLLQSKFAEVEHCVEFHQRAWAEKLVWPGVCSFRSNFWWFCHPCV